MTLSWSDRYGDRHRLIRIDEFPAGIEPPKRVRVYLRRNHFVLQWWDTFAGRNLCHRVKGELLSAVTCACEIEKRLVRRRSTGKSKPQLPHAELVKQFLADLKRRANAGQIAALTVRRYASALEHYLAFVQDPNVLRSFPFACSINGRFAKAFSAFLQQRLISRKGSAKSRPRPMRGQAFVKAAMRALLHWGKRDCWFAPGFRVPKFPKTARRRTGRKQAGPLNITMDMAVQFIQACDAYQLRLFAPIVLFGLRAAEPCFLFYEDLADGWLHVSCRPELAYQVKGRRDTAFPVADCIQSLWKLCSQDRSVGLLYVPRLLRRLGDPFLHASLPRLVEEFKRRCAEGGVDPGQRRLIRDRLLKEAGAVTYDQIEHEFKRIARQLEWPGQATIKDFRHLFHTSLQEAGVPKHYCQYLMGRATKCASISVKAHLKKVAKHYRKALDTVFKPFVEAVAARTAELHGLQKIATATRRGEAWTA